jgi:hypothetical protein
MVLIGTGKRGGIVPILKAEDVRPLLLRPDRHWKPGRSAAELAAAWVPRVPRGVTQILTTAKELAGAVPALGIFERRTPMPARGGPSRTDLLVVFESGNARVVAAIEGKAGEDFDKTVDTWLRAGKSNRSAANRRKRLAGLCRTLGLQIAQVNALRCQLLHRTVAALVEARLWGAAEALVIVHSFDDAAHGFDDFAAFAGAVGAPVTAPGQLGQRIVLDGIGLRLGWVQEKAQAAKAISRPARVGGNVSASDEIAQVTVGAPHMVILGAGASLAALPDGDRRGMKPPLMGNFVSTLGLGSLLERHGVNSSTDDFEALYSEILERPDCQDLRAAIEEKVYEYFSRYALPDKPMLYDHLVLSLRKKDIIATFNWDPLLVHAYSRNRERVSDLPSLYFLHGSVAAWHCPAHLRRVGAPGTRCPECGAQFARTPLIYPVARKDYSSDPFIAQEWEITRRVLENAFALTVFGYGAPTSDKDAVDLLRIAWDSHRARELVETEIIDIKPAKEIERIWSPFFYSHHYTLCDDFYRSWIGTHPRRSCEALWNQNMEAQWITANPIPRDASFEELYRWLQPFREAEQAVAGAMIDRRATR